MRYDASICYYLALQTWSMARVCRGPQLLPRQILSYSVASDAFATSPSAEPTESNVTFDNIKEVPYINYNVVDIGFHVLL